MRLILLVLSVRLGIFFGAGGVTALLGFFRIAAGSGLSFAAGLSWSAVSQEPWPSAGRAPPSGLLASTGLWAVRRVFLEFALGPNGSAQHDPRLRHGGGDNLGIIGLFRESLLERMMAQALGVQGRLHRRCRQRQLEGSNGGNESLKLARHALSSSRPAAPIFFQVGPLKV